MDLFDPKSLIETFGTIGLILIIFAESGLLLGLIGRKPKKLAAVAWANKAARVAWAMMVNGEAYGLRAKAA